MGKLSILPRSPLGHKIKKVKGPSLRALISQSYGGIVPFSRYKWRFGGRERLNLRRFLESTLGQNQLPGDGTSLYPALDLSRTDGAIFRDAGHYKDVMRDMLAWERELERIVKEREITPSRLYQASPRDRAVLQFLAGSLSKTKFTVVRNAVQPLYWAEPNVPNEMNLLAPIDEYYNRAIRLITKKMTSLAGSGHITTALASLRDEAPPRSTNAGSPHLGSGVAAKMHNFRCFAGMLPDGWKTNIMKERGSVPGTPIILGRSLRSRISLISQYFEVPEAAILMASAMNRRTGASRKPGRIWKAMGDVIRQVAEMANMVRSRKVFMASNVKNLMLAAVNVYLTQFRKSTTGLYHDEKTRRFEIRWRRGRNNTLSIPSDISSMDLSFPGQLRRDILRTSISNASPVHPSFVEFAEQTIYAPYMVEDPFAWATEFNGELLLLIATQAVGLGSGDIFTSGIDTLASFLIAMITLMMVGFSADTVLNPKPSDPVFLKVQGDDVKPEFDCDQVDFRTIQRYIDLTPVVGAALGFKVEIDLDNIFLMRHELTLDGLVPFGAPVTSRILQNTFGPEKRRGTGSEGVAILGAAARSLRHGTHVAYVSHDRDARRVIDGYNDIVASHTSRGVKEMLLTSTSDGTRRAMIERLGAILVADSDEYSSQLIELAQEVILNRFGNTGRELLRMLADDPNLQAIATALRADGEFDARLHDEGWRLLTGNFPPNNIKQWIVDAEQS